MYFKQNILLEETHYLHNKHKHIKMIFYAISGTTAGQGLIYHQYLGINSP